MWKMKASFSARENPFQHRGTFWKVGTSFFFFEQQKRPLQFSPGLGYKWTLERFLIIPAGLFHAFVTHASVATAKTKKQFRSQALHNAPKVAAPLLQLGSSSEHVRSGGCTLSKYHSLLFIYLHSYSAQGTQCAFETQLFIYIRRRLPPCQINLMFRGEAPEAPPPDDRPDLRGSRWLS